MHHDGLEIDDVLLEPLRLGFYRVANAPVRYRAVEVGATRFGWTVPTLPAAPVGGMLPRHYALTLGASPTGDWHVEDLKPFERAEDAERWARGLARDAARRARSRG